MKMAVRAVPIEEVLNLSTQIRGRLKKEAGGPDMLKELKETNPRLVQLMVDIDSILTSWGHQIVKGVRT
jgi:hypothetical protein